MAALETISPDTPKVLPELRWSGADDQISNGDYKLTAPFSSSEVDNEGLKITVVISTLSGIQQASAFFEQDLKPLLEVLYPANDYEVEYTKDANTISDLTKSVFLKRAQAGISQLVILLSGDGGIVDVINALGSEPKSSTYHSPEIALIPMGTGNALANSSGITADNTLGLSTLARGSPANLPTLRATFSNGARLLTHESEVEEELSLKDDEGKPIMYGAVVGSWGLHASLVADSDTAEYRKFGVERFGMAAKENLYPTDGSGPHKYRARVSLLRNGSLEWTPLDRQDHAYILATMVSNLEKGFTISPESEPLSGKLRVVHFGPLPGDEVMRLMTLAYQGGQHIKESEVGYEEIEGMRIQFDGMEEDSRWRRICLDGKIIRLEKDGWVEIKPEKSTFVSLRHLKR